MVQVPALGLGAPAARFAAQRGPLASTTSVAGDGGCGTELSGSPPLRGPANPSRRKERDLQLSRRTLKGNEAQEGPVRPRQQWCGAKPGPGDGARPRSRRRAPTSRADAAPAMERREPGRSALTNGKGATAAVTQRGCHPGVPSRGVSPARRESLRAPDLRSATRRRKRCEPQDRQRDATSPRTAMRRKPSRWCKTTRTERDFGDGSPGLKREVALRAEVDATQGVGGGAIGASSGPIGRDARTETQERRSI